MLLIFRQAAAGSQAQDTITFADSQSAIAVFSSTRGESISFTDSQSSIAVFGSTDNESVALTDSQSAIAVFASARNESLTFTDAQTASSVFPVTVNDSIAFADSQSASIAGQTATVGETVAFSDSQSSTLTPGVDPFIAQYGGLGKLSPSGRAAIKREHDARKKLEEEQQQLAEELAIEYAITQAQQKQSVPREITLAQIIGKKAFSMMDTTARIELEAKIQGMQHRQRLRREDDELLMMY